VDCGRPASAARACAVKLGAQQEAFDGICDKFWDVATASAAMADACVAAVQARNADTISLNQQVAGICEEPMTGIEPALSTWGAEVIQ